MQSRQLAHVAPRVSCGHGSRSTRIGKYEFLRSNSHASISFSRIEPCPPFYLFVPHDAHLAQEWKQCVSIADLYPRNSAGIITARDGLVIGEDRQELAERLERFSDATGDVAAIYEEFGFSASKRFDLAEAQAELRRLTSFSDPIRRMLHRPFDERFIFFHPSVVWSLSRPMADQMAGGDNLALIATRQVTRPQFEHAFISRHMIEIKACSHDRNTQIFPLFLRDLHGDLGIPSEVVANLSGSAMESIARASGLKLNSGTRELGEDDELTPLRIFNYVYAILYSPTYRERYFQLLRSDFPRIPLPGNVDVFRALAIFGGNLVSAHLMESPKFDDFITTYTGPRNPEVGRIGWSNDIVWLDATATKKGQSATPGTIGFRGVPEAVWNFHIGGYQVCEKWLKDRRGRMLSDEDIAHYGRIVVALRETIRIMTEIDAEIEDHGGWPAAFQSVEVGSRP